LAVLAAVAAPSLQHFGDARPSPRALVLARELAHAIAPAAVRDHRRDALVDAAGIDRDRAAEARADHRDALPINGRMLREEAERIAGILDLLQADHAAELALAVAATAHAETQNDVAELAQHLGRRLHVG